MSSTTLAMYHTAVNELNLWFPLCPEPEVVPRIYTYRLPVATNQPNVVLTQDTSVSYALSYRTWKDFVRLQNPDHDYTCLLNALSHCMHKLPQAIYPVIYYARALWAVKEYQQARSLLHRAIGELRTDDVFARQVLGETCFFAAHYHEAASLLQTVINAEPERVRPHVALALVIDHLARQAESDEDRARWMEQMIHNLERALSLAPEKAHAIDPLLKSAQLRLAEFRV